MDAASTGRMYIYNLDQAKTNQIITINYSLPLFFSALATDKVEVTERVRGISSKEES